MGLAYTVLLASPTPDELSCGSRMRVRTYSARMKLLRNSLKQSKSETSCGTENPKRSARVGGRGGWWMKLGVSRRVTD